MSVMSAAEAGQSGGAGPDLPGRRPRLRVATPAPDRDRGDGPDSLLGPGSGTQAGPGADGGAPWLAADARSAELRVREVRIVRRASTVRRRASSVQRGAGLPQHGANTAQRGASTAQRGASTAQRGAGGVPGGAGAVQDQATEVAARTSTATQARAVSYARAAGMAGTSGTPGTPGTPGMPAATRSRVAAQSRIVTQTRIVARTRTATQRSQRPAAIRLTRRGRLVVAGFAMLVVIVAATVLWMTAAGSVQASSRGGAPGSPYQGMTQVVVRPGQTLWSIAAAAEPAASSWAVVQQITEVNALNGATIHAGQLLWVPKG
jgi:nucleoid-associated protein YgaU